MLFLGKKIYIAISENNESIRLAGHQSLFFQILSKVADLSLIILYLYVSLFVSSFISLSKVLLIERYLAYFFFFCFFVPRVNKSQTIERRMDIDKEMEGLMNLFEFSFDINSLRNV